MKKEMMTDLKKTLNKIYANIRERIEPKTWHAAISPAYEEAPLETSMEVIDFLLAHEYMPASCFRAACHAIELRERPSLIADIYSEKVVDHLFEKMVKKETLRYDYIALGTQEAEIREIIDLAEKTEKHLERGQIYLAGKGMERLRNFSSTHPDVLDMQKRYLDIRVTGGVNASDFQPVDVLKKYETTERKVDLTQFNDSDDAIAYCEKLIEKDYRNFYAYFTLGQLYLEDHDVQKADYLAGLLLDFDEEKKDACTLKAMILESKGQPEDAAFYRRRAAMLEPAAAPQDGSFKYKEKVQPVIVQIVEHCDDLIRKGRTTEAYYELLKRSAEYPDSTVLKFKKGFLLYLMKREPEARALMKEITESSPVYENAVYITEDIDFDIVENDKFDEMHLSTAAEIMFNTGKHEASLNLYRKIPDIDMTGRAWSVRGRCEVYAGFLNSALKSFSAALESGDKSLNVREITGMIHMIRGENEKALQLYDDAIVRGENVESVTSAKASLLFDMGRKEELLIFRREAERLLGRGSDVDGYAGLITMEEDSMSMSYLNKAVDAHSGRSVFYLAAAEKHIAAEEYEKALRCVETGLSYAEDGEEELFVKKLRVLYLAGKHDVAKAAARKLMEKYPENAEVCYLLGMVHAKVEENIEAIVYLSSAVDKNPMSHTYTYALADRCFVTGDYDMALKFYTTAIGLDSTDYISFKRRAAIYSKREDDEKALADLDCAMLLKPDDAEIYVLVGNILAGYDFDDSADVVDTEPATEDPSAELIEEGDKAEAETSADNAQEDIAAAEGTEAEGENKSSFMEDTEKDSEYYYTKAIEMDPSYRQGYISRAKFYAEKKRLEEALADIEKAIELDPEDASAYMVRGIIRNFSGLNEQAIEDFKKAAAAEELAVQCYSYMAKCCNALERYDEAISYAEYGLQKNPEFMNLNVNRGVAFYKLTKYNLAIEDFKKVISKKYYVNTAALGSAYMFRGMSYDRLDQKEEAVNDYKMALKYNSENENIRTRMQELEQQIEAAKPKPKFTLRRLFGK